MKIVAALVAAIMIMPLIGSTTVSAKKYKNPHHTYHPKNPPPKHKTYFPPCNTTEKKAAEFVKRGGICTK